MNQHQPADANEPVPTNDPIETLPAEVTSPEAKLVYLYVHQTGACTAEELAARLRLSKLAVFPHLRTLLDRGLLRREEAHYVPADGTRDRMEALEASD